MVMKMEEEGGFRLTGFMVKRSQMRSRIRKSDNFKSRWFVLRPRTLKYYDGSLEKGLGKEKGCVSVAKIVVVEEVDLTNVDPTRTHGFQIGYNNTKGEFFILYIVAQTKSQLDEWLEKLREARQDNMSGHVKYHPKAWSAPGGYGCCGQTDRLAEGCNVTHDHKHSIPTASSIINETTPSGVPSDTTCPFGIEKPAQATANSSKSGGTPTPSKSSYCNNTKPPQMPQPAKPSTPKPELPNALVIALYDFSDDQDDTLSLNAGEEYELLPEVERNDHWSRAKNSSGKIGLIPNNYIKAKSDNPMEGFGWYFKGTSRGQAEGILRKDGRDGCFLIRDSTQTTSYSLALYTVDSSSGKGLIRHYHIKTNPDTKLVYLSEKHPKSTVPELIDYHNKNPGGLAGRLKHSPGDGRQSAPWPYEGTVLQYSDLEIGEVVGSGNFGTVNKGIYKGVREVAVKRTNPGAMNEEEFQEEAKTMLQLQHRHLVRTYGVCFKPLCIVSEFMNQGSLLFFLKARRNKPFMGQSSILLDMCHQVSMGMAYLESLSFIHRDLAARNCLVGENNLVKVGDFGLSRFTLDDEYTSTNSKFPIKWAAPEILSYNKFSSKSDVWSFGILVWEVFSGGSTPYRGKKNAEVVTMLQRGQRMEKPHHATDFAHQTMQACWEGRPEKRPTFSDLVEMISSQLSVEQDYVD